MEGIATILHDYFARFDKDQFDVSMIAEGEIAPEARQAFESIGVHLIEGPARKKDLLKYLAFLRKTARDFDVFYINGSSALLAPDLQAAKAARVPVRLVESHNTRTSHASLDKAMRPLFYSSYTSALACSEAAGRWLFGKRPFTLVKNGRSPETYAFDPEMRTEMRKKLGLQDSTLAICQVGNLNPVKNQKFLVDVFACIKKMQPDARLYLIGAGQSEEDLKQQIRNLHLENDVVLTGKITNVADYLQAMDLMVLPSLHEGLPLVAVEWQMNGLPSLLSDTITQECVFSDLIHFASLQDSPQQWAETLLAIPRPDRQSASAQGIENACAAGFNIDENARELQERIRALAVQAGIQ